MYERNYSSYISEEALPEGRDIYGGINWPIAELMSKCTDAEVGRPPCQGVLQCCTQGQKLCGGLFFTPSCMGDLMSGLQVDFSVTLRDWNNRPDPLDWGFYPGPTASAL